MWLYTFSLFGINSLPSLRFSCVPLWDEEAFLVSLDTMCMKKLEGYWRNKYKRRYKI